MMKMGGGGAGRKGGIGLTAKQVDPDELRRSSDALKERQKRAQEQAKAERAAELAGQQPSDTPPEEEHTEVPTESEHTEVAAESEHTEPAVDTVEATGSTELKFSDEHGSEAASADSTPTTVTPVATASLVDLIAGLGQLRTELRSRATEPEHDEAVAAIGRAERALRQAQTELTTAGAWPLEVAREVGVTSVVDALASLS